MPDTESTESSRRKLVLVLEKDQIMQGVHESLIDAHNLRESCEFTFARSGAAAQAIVAGMGRNPDVIILGDSLSGKEDPLPVVEKLLASGGSMIVITAASDVEKRRSHVTKVGAIEVQPYFEAMMKLKKMP